METDNIEDDYFDEDENGSFTDIVDKEDKKEAQTKLLDDSKLNKEETITGEVEEDNNSEKDDINVVENVEGVRKVELISNSREIVRQFGKTELSEIHKYISTNLQYSVLQQIFTLTEKPQLKAQVYTVVYRLIVSASRYVGNSETRKKLQKLIKDVNILKISKEETVDIHAIIYEALAKYTNNVVNFNKHRLQRKIDDIFINQKYNERINKLIDAFLVFVERHELLDIDKIVGLDLETEEGIKTMNDMLNEKGEIDV